MLHVQVAACSCVSGIGLSRSDCLCRVFLCHDFTVCLFYIHGHYYMYIYLYIHIFLSFVCFSLLGLWTSLSELKFYVCMY